MRATRGTKGSTSADAWVIRLGFVAAMSAATLGVERSPQPRGLQYHYYKELRSLEFDPEHIAVFIRNTVTTGGALTLSRTGAAVEVSRATPWHFPGWSLLPTRVGAKMPEQIVASVEALTAAPEVEFVSPVYRGEQGGPVLLTSVLLVQFHPSVTPGRAESILREHRAGIVLDRDWANMHGAYRVQTAARDAFAVLDIANALAQRDDVIFSEPNFIFTGRGELLPNDTQFGDLWGLHNIGQAGGTPDIDMDAPEAWDITVGDPSIKVVIIDTGIQQDHPDINQLPGMDLTTDPDTLGGAPDNACDNHGTQLAGSISGIMNNGLGIVGIAPACKVVSARTFISLEPCDGSFTGQSFTTVEALAFAESIGAKVTNNSNSYDPIRSAAIDAKYAETRAKGMIHFASAGVGNNPIANYPAWLPTVNTIAGVERHGNRSSLTNYGPDLFLTAPGEDILSTDRTGADGSAGGDYTTLTGSSLATSYTAGVAALVLSMNPSRPAWAVETILKTTAVDRGTPGFDFQFGWGIVNAHAAVLAAAQPCSDAGTPDCNANNIVDSCDLFDGTSADCNANGVPDECESAADCQPNGIVDICEIGLGLSKDCNRNSVPDECDLSALASADCDANAVPDECDNAAPGTIVSDRPPVNGFVEISATGTPLGLGDDTVAIVTMPFAAAAFSRSDLVVSNDGAIGLDGRATLLNPNAPLPSENAFARGEALLPYWDDLDRTSGNVYYDTIGMVPNRTFIVEWFNRPRNPGDTELDGDEGTFQVQIFESPVDNIVAQYLYTDTNFLDVDANDGRSATIGFQRTSSQVLQWSSNAVAAVSAGTVLSLLRGDTNQNARPDVCDIAAPARTPGPDRSRTLGINPSTAVATPSALRVTLLDFQNPNPANPPCCPPQDFSAYESGPSCSDPGGCVRWVAAPHVYLESQGSPAAGSFRAARLQCTPLYHDWSAEGAFSILGAEIMPSSRYSVQTIGLSCLGNETTCLDTSPPLQLSTARSGDVASPYNPPAASSQPNALDVVAIVNKFRNVSGAAPKSAAQLQPNLPNLYADINALDVTACVDAFRGFAYPFSGPCPCPPAVACNATPCANPSPCGGGLCTKTCLGGDNDNEPCITDAHCPGGTCGTGFCTDRCGRCAP